VGGEGGREVGVTFRIGPSRASRTESESLRRSTVCSVSSRTLLSMAPVPVRPAEAAGAGGGGGEHRWASRPEPGVGRWEGGGGGGGRGGGGRCGGGGSRAGGRGRESGVVGRGHASSRKKHAAPALRTTASTTDVIRPVAFSELTRIYKMQHDFVSRVGLEDRARLDGGSCRGRLAFTRVCGVWQERSPQSWPVRAGRRENGGH